MQYVRSISGSISGSVSKTWNSINPATLSGAIDVVVVEREDGSLACSPFHVRFGKFQLLQPFNKKVEFTVNEVKREFPMKVGEGGEAFFVFETSDNIPTEMQTSPLVSPVTSPQATAAGVEAPGLSTSSAELPEPEPLDLGATDDKRKTSLASLAAGIERPKSAEGTIEAHSEFDPLRRPASGDWSAESISKYDPPGITSKPPVIEEPSSNSPEAYVRAVNLSKRLWTHKISTTVSPSGDIMLDMTGYKSNDDSSLQAEIIARRILSEEIEGNMDIGSLIGADENGNLWIYSSEEAKAAADRKSSSLRALNPVAMRSQDALSDPGYYSDDNLSDVEGVAQNSKDVNHGDRRDSDSAVGLSTPGSPEGQQRRESTGSEPVNNDDFTVRNFAKTLRLTHDQLKSLDLKPGPNTMTFTVNKASCSGYIYYWKHDVPIVISDIDGTITKSDALGHVLNMIGRDWTHVGVAKLYTDIVANGYHILYLTSRSVGQADTTRGYLNGIMQDGYKLPKGPVIMSPDRTMAALRREVYLRKPEVFKMACLRDIMNLFGSTPSAAAEASSAAVPVSPTSPTSAITIGDTHYVHQRTPFYAGFGNRLTDALSYRSVAIPPTRIFTINSNAEVSLHLLTLNKFRTSYLSIWELVDHFFPPVGLLVKEGGEDYTDFNYWRDKTFEIDDFSTSESEDDEHEASEEEYDEEDEYDEDMEGSFMSRDSLDIEPEEDVRESGVLEPVEEEDEESQGEEEVMESSILESVVDGDEEEHEEEEHDVDHGPSHEHKHENESTTEAPSTQTNDDILITESLPIDALSLEAEEEVVHSQPSLTRAVTVPEREAEWTEKEKENE